MEFLIILILIIIIILLFSIKNNLDREINTLSVKLDHLKTSIHNLIGDKSGQKETFRNPEILHKEVIPPVQIIKEDPVYVPNIKTEIKIENIPPIREKPFIKPKVHAPSFFERNPDLEKFIGEDLINKIGIGILVLGIAFFVKFAIDNNWIHEIGRVFIGILCGGILVGVAHKTRKDFKAFSSVLVGGGIAIFYFTITIAFHEYQLLSQTSSFLIMIIITAFAVLLSITYDRKELAVLAIIGGFASPFMVNTGEGNYIVLFSYILILNIGMLVLAYFKKWNLLNVISYIFTIILYGGWLVSRVANNPDAPLLGALVFGTLFYLVFFVMNIINNIKENRKFLAAEISILLSNTFLYYSAGMLILNNLHDGIYNGLFTILLAIFNFVFAFILYKNKKADTNLVYLLIGLVLTFISLAAPVQLEGNYITLFWSVESVLLLWLSQKSGIKLIKLGSILIIGLMFISLIMDWHFIYSSGLPLRVILNKAFITSMISVVSIFASLLLLKKEEPIIIYRLSKKAYKTILTIFFTAFLYLSILLELSFQLNIYIETESMREVIIGSYNFLFILGLMFYTYKKENSSLKFASTCLAIAGFIVFAIYYHQYILQVRDEYLYGLSPLGYYLYHYIDTFLIIGILYFGLKNIALTGGVKSDFERVYFWFMSFAIVFIASAELDHIVLLYNYAPELFAENIISQNHKIGFPILWGICSFIFMTIGMNKKIKSLRIISLSLFFITILKLFIFDLQGISEGGKIAAFICLGILLLIVSFMYQKLKKLVLEDESKPLSVL